MDPYTSQCFPEEQQKSRKLFHFHKLFDHHQITNAYLDLDSLKLKFGCDLLDLVSLKIFHQELFPISYSDIFFLGLYLQKTKSVLLLGDILLFKSNFSNEDSIIPETEKNSDNNFSPTNSENKEKSSNFENLKQERVGIDYFEEFLQIYYESEKKKLKKKMGIKDEIKKSKVSIKNISLGDFDKIKNTSLENEKDKKGNPEIERSTIKSQKLKKEKDKQTLKKQNNKQSNLKKSECLDSNNENEILILKNVFLGFSVYKKEPAHPDHLTFIQSLKGIFKNYWSAHIQTLGILPQCRRLKLGKFLIDFTEYNLLNQPKPHIFSYSDFICEHYPSEINKQLSSPKNPKSLKNKDNVKEKQFENKLGLKDEFDELFLLDIQKNHFQKLNKLKKNQLKKHNRFINLKGETELNDISNIFSFCEIQFPILENLQSNSFEEFSSFIFSSSQSKFSKRISKNICFEVKRQKLKTNFKKWYLKKFQTKVKQQSKQISKYLTQKYTKKSKSEIKKHSFKTEKDFDNYFNNRFNEKRLMTHEIPLSPHYLTHPISISSNNMISSLEALLLDKIVIPFMLKEIDHIQLELIESNISGMEFYLRNGFELKRICKKYYNILDKKYDSLKLIKSVRNFNV